MNTQDKEKQLIRATLPYAKENRTKSWGTTFSTLAVIAIAFVGIFAPTALWVKILSSVLLGLTLVRFFIIYHDYAHNSILQKSTFAKWLFTFFGLYILAPLSIWRRSHDHHHQHNSKLYTSSIGSYPIVTKEKFLSATKKEQRLYLFARHPLTIAFGYIFVFIGGMCIRSLMNNPKRHWDSAISLGLHLVMGIIMYLAGGWTGLILGLIVPSFIAFAIGAYLFYAQHNFPGVYFADKNGWTYINAAMKSSSFMKMNPLMHWFTGNIGYHHIHHLNAKIPFYRLPEVYREIPELQKAKTTSLKARDIMACFRLKVWDVEQQKMVGL
ncbi:fatty acid desaturase family protein [Flavilitoribacter nigricans]|uniref:Fatty acid desaturase n=1 Tax=Flavilitoribacter nigricans (strain ATCC 23147 / DSM 23189 / NBRC 102662 / NCIMB 1420 / SS-2) TaxID=1122177 RepID=A0A2D0N3Q2_FLAN2|nr:fatty acid desaturase [Flavilitoribacter nigricans]PHN03018.1 fatty acid desaturase [Flavilitoribacter nigricans DSM 23189 = NBRC 102662]